MMELRTNRFYPVTINVFIRVMPLFNDLDFKNKLQVRVIWFFVHLQLLKILVKRSKEYCFFGLTIIFGLEAELSIEYLFELHLFRVGGVEVDVRER